jgi:hypothetical protein
MKENNTLCDDDDDVHLSIHDLVSVTTPLLRFCETWFEFFTNICQARKSSVKTGSDIHALLEDLNEFYLYFPHMLPDLGIQYR